jgi:outer membrane receptor protein involved in Fe transport
MLIVLGASQGGSLLHAQAEGAIQGVVIAAADQSGVPNTTVRLEGPAENGSRQVVTEADGRFGFQRLTPGDYVLVVEHANFAETRSALTLRPREVRNVILELALRSVQQSVEVQGETNEIPTTYSPGSTLLSSRRLDSLPLTQSTNLPDVIVTSSPGMIRGHDDFVHIRGHEIALNPFINGVAFWENPHVVFSPGLGVDYIESMNVMTGGFPAEYGNRFGGVLDVVTKSGFTMDYHGSVALGVGTAGRNNAGVELGGRSERFGYYLNATGFESDRFLSPPEPVAIHDTGRGSRGFAQFDFAPNLQNFLKLVLMGDGSNFQLPMAQRDVELRPDFTNFQRTRSQALILSWDYLPSGTTSLRTAFYQKWSRVRILPNGDRYGAKLDAERTLRTIGTKADLTRSFGRHTLKGGIDLVQLRPNEGLYYLSQPWIDFTHLPDIDENHIHFRGPNLGAGIPRPVVFNEAKTGAQGSLYLQDRIQVTRGFTADVGLRFDRYSLAISESQFSPRVNLAYRFTPGTVVHASYNRFFVPPPVENVLASSAGLTRYISEVLAVLPQTGGVLPPLRPIKEDQFELGVTQPLARVLRVGLTGYYRISNDPPHTVLFPDSRFYAYANFDKGKAYGLEIKMEMPSLFSTGLSGYFNYALGRVWFYNPITAGFTTEAEHINESGKFLAPMDQLHTLTSGVTYRHRRSGLWTALAFEYGSGTPGGHGAGEHEHEEEEPDHEHAPVPGGCGVRCPSHFTQNLSLGWDGFVRGDRPRLGLQFNVENLSNHVYLISRESTFVQAQYSIPRLFSWSLKYRF